MVHTPCHFAAAQISSGMTANLHLPQSKARAPYQLGLLHERKGKKTTFHTEPSITHLSTSLKNTRSAKTPRKLKYYRPFLWSRAPDMHHSIFPAEVIARSYNDIG